MKENALQVRFVARGDGVVECLAECRGEVVGGFGLAYPEQGRMIGSPPVADVVARRLNLAAGDLNAVLEELAS